MEGIRSHLRAALGLDQPPELQALQTQLLKRLLWLLLLILAVLAASDALHARPTLPLLLGMLAAVALSLPALSRWNPLRAPVTLLFGLGLLAAVWLEAGYFDVAVPPSTVFLILGGPLVTLIVAPGPGIVLTLLTVAGQLWLEHTYPFEGARALRSMGNAIIAVGWAQMTALLFQRAHADLARRLVGEQRSLRQAGEQVQGMAKAVFDDLQVPLLALSIRLSEPEALSGGDLAPHVDALSERLQRARERAREAAPVPDPAGTANQLAQLRRLSLLAQLWAGWAALLVSSVQGLTQGVPVSVLWPDITATVLLGTGLLVFRRRLNALRPVSWAGALLVLTLIGWALGQWGGQYPAPPFYFLAPLVLVMALLDGLAAGAVVAAISGALVLWAMRRSPHGGEEMDQAMNVMATLLLALFASVQALVLHRQLDGRLAAEGAALQRALRLRRRLLGTLFHDLSNPLALLQLAVELNEGAPVDAAERARLQQMVERMHALVDSALDFVAMDGALPPDRLQAVPLGPLLAELKALLQPRLDAAGQELRIYCAPQLTVQAAPVALRESVIGNLLKLAQARCGAGAKLTLSASSQGDGVLIKLEDPGRPLSEQDLGATGPLLLVEDGPGLGLALVHEHLLRMSGRLELANLDGGGSLATVRLPPGLGS